MKTIAQITPKPTQLTPRDMGVVLPGYAINEYQLVLLPHEALRNKIIHVKQHFADTYIILLRKTSCGNNTSWYSLMA